MVTWYKFAFGVNVMLLTSLVIDLCGGGIEENVLSGAS